MKIFFGVLICLTVGMLPAHAVVTGRADGAVLRGLDKVSGQATDLRIRVGQAVDYGHLNVRLAECRFPADDPGSDAFVQLIITDQSRNKTVFSGWMVASSPALSALDDARYDIWAISCSKAGLSSKGGNTKDAGTDKE